MFKKIVGKVKSWLEGLDLTDIPEIKTMTIREIETSDGVVFELTFNGDKRMLVSIEECEG